ncbi:MAG: succinylglutamate desuccinylase/aspartoacylase family protein [Gemmatimonadales bacterium]|nr:MAG: succinylglutamate desuccinylase/aspartoacylase family protein [Gemmatimonadales bacterium]
MEVGGTAVAPGTSAQLEIPVARLATHTMLHLPVMVVNGKSDGARLWLSAALHGDELNGMEIIRQVLERVNPRRLRGAVLAVPVVNVFGFINQSRYLPDRRDLNRSFPGTRRGSLASRLAWLFMREIVDRCTHGIDLHTAAPPRVNLPQIRGDLDDPETRRCAAAFAAPLMLTGKPPGGSLRMATSKRKIPTLLYEAGEPLRFNPDAIEIGVAGVLRVMAALDMIDSAPRTRTVSVEARRSTWIRASQSGVTYLDVKLGQRVADKERLGRITDPFGNAAAEIHAPLAGIVIGHTIQPLVYRGDAVIHLAAVQ